ncbi:hypothetical protein D3OALGB2SA_5815 [Olavius algarvensis associated proteobacterium Delta 3]|nr:hypothetical protein D3OALGB2SA_5815 [Olavius algarvensis associated proteobacterium Delta 3]
MTSPYLEGKDFPPSPGGREPEGGGGMDSFLFLSIVPIQKDSTDAVELLKIRWS